MDKSTWQSIAESIADTSFDTLDAERVAVHRAVLVVDDHDLRARKYVFNDASFMTIRADNCIAVDPRSGQSLRHYAEWIGFASPSEIAAVSTLFNLLDAGSMLVH